MNEKIYNDYLKLSGEITKKLDNTASYEIWLIIQEYIDILIKENQQLKENNQALQEEIAKTWAKLDKKEKIIDKAREYINKTKYSDLVGLNSYSINEFWFIKELLEILKESDK